MTSFYVGYAQLQMYDISKHITELNERLMSD